MTRLNTLNKKRNISHNVIKKGTGLGLTLVKQVIEHHGGLVAIHNMMANDGQDNMAMSQLSGVMVSITLPLAKE